MISPEKPNDTDRGREISLNDGLLGVLSGTMVGWERVDFSGAFTPDDAPKIDYEFEHLMPGKTPVENISLPGDRVSYRRITSKEAQMMIDSSHASENNEEPFGA